MTKERETISLRDAYNSLQAQNAGLRLVLQQILARLALPATLPLNISHIKQSALASVNTSRVNGTPEEAESFRQATSREIEAIFWGLDVK